MNPRSPFYDHVRARLREFAEDGVFEVLHVLVGAGAGPMERDGVVAHAAHPNAERALDLLLDAGFVRPTPRGFDASPDGRALFPVLAPLFEWAHARAPRPPWSGLADHIRSTLAELGKTIELERTAALFAPQHGREAYEHATIARDLSYGPDTRNVLDVFTPNQPVATGRPVLVFVPGGGFQHGDKHPHGAYFYDNVALWAAREGLVGVTVDYRLAPAHRFPSGVEDLQHLLAWLDANIVRFGGNPEHIFLWGHSAGAAHVADTLSRTRPEPAGVRGAILTSGTYQLPKDEVSVWSAYYGDDITTYAARSSLPGLQHGRVPLLVTDAELDLDSFQHQADALMQALERSGRPARRLRVAHHTHISEILGVGTPDRSLSAPVLQFIRELSNTV